MSEYVDVTVHHFPTERGGRRHPIYPRPEGSARYLPHFRVDRDGEELGVAFVDGPSPIPPGSEGSATVALIYDIDYSPLAVGAEFEVLEGPHVVGTGIVRRRWASDVDWHHFAQA